MSRSDGASLRVVRTGALSPALNLAIDDVLLTQGVGTTVRTYRWEPAGLSIGRFQDPKWFADVAGTHQLVRRSTGGGAIYHGDELTFSVAFDARVGWDTDETYVRIHDAILQALASIGARSQRVPADAPAPSPRAQKNAWCFAVAGRHDLVAPDGRKLLGSAQRRVRRPRDRILLHGSLVLGRPQATPFVAAVADQVAVDEIRARLEDAVIDELATSLEPGSHASERPLTSTELAEAAARARRFELAEGANTL